MRISVRPDDPGYSPHVPDSRVIVTLDGVPCEWVITADEETGEVISYAVQGGRPYCQEDGEPVILVRRGRVRINVPPDFPRDPQRRTLQ